MGIVFLLLFLRGYLLGFLITLLVVTSEIAEISFQQRGDRAGLANITVMMINLSLLRTSSGCRPK